MAPGVSGLLDSRAKRFDRGKRLVTRIEVDDGFVLCSVVVADESGKLIGHATSMLTGGTGGGWGPTPAEQQHHSGK